MLERVILLLSKLAKIDVFSIVLFVISGGFDLILGFVCYGWISLIWVELAGSVAWFAQSTPQFSILVSKFGILVFVTCYKNLGFRDQFGFGYRDMLL